MALREIRKSLPAILAATGIGGFGLRELLKLSQHLVEISTPSVNHNMGVVVDRTTTMMQYKTSYLTVNIPTTPTVTLVPQPVEEKDVSDVPPTMAFRQQGGTHSPLAFFFFLISVVIYFLTPYLSLMSLTVLPILGLLVGTLYAKSGLIHLLFPHMYQSKISASTEQSNKDTSAQTDDSSVLEMYKDWSKTFGPSTATSGCPYTPEELAASRLSFMSDSDQLEFLRIENERLFAAELSRDQARRRCEHLERRVNELQSETGTGTAGHVRAIGQNDSETQRYTDRNGTVQPLSKTKRELREQTQLAMDRAERIRRLRENITAKETQLEELKNDSDDELAKIRAKLAEKETQLAEKNAQLLKINASLTTQKSELAAKDRNLTQGNSKLVRQDARVVYQYGTIRRYKYKVQKLRQMNATLKRELASRPNNDASFFDPTFFGFDSNIPLDLLSNPVQTIDEGASDQPRSSDNFLLPGLCVDHASGIIVDLDPAVDTPVANHQGQTGGDSEIVIMDNEGKHDSQAGAGTYFEDSWAQNLDFDGMQNVFDDTSIGSINLQGDQSQANVNIHTQHLDYNGMQDGIGGRLIGDPNPPSDQSYANTYSYAQDLDPNTMQSGFDDFANNYINLPSDQNPANNHEAANNDTSHNIPYDPQLS
ncbi:hypothetical protein ACLMJK_001887 [Lecanora helva]